jgi:hypothetical protein
MKRILFFILCLFMFISCGKKEDEFTGTWIYSNWKKRAETVEIKENGGNNYIVKQSVNNDEFSATKKDNILKLDLGFINLDITIDKNTKELLFEGDRFTKLTPELQKEIDKYFEELKRKITGTWKLEREENIGFPGTQIINVSYTYVITPIEGDLFHIKATILSGKNKKISEKEVKLTLEGNLKTIKQITNDNILLTRYYLFDNVEELEKLNKIK